MRSSEIIRHKAVRASDLRVPLKRTNFEKQDPRLVERNYCRDCDHRKRGNDWEKDYCRAFKKLCKFVRGGKGYIRMACGKFKAKHHGS